MVRRRLSRGEECPRRGVWSADIREPLLVSPSCIDGTYLRRRGRGGRDGGLGFFRLFRGRGGRSTAGLADHQLPTRPRTTAVIGGGAWRTHKEKSRMQETRPIALMLIPFWHIICKNRCC